MKYNFDCINPQLEAETRRQASINRLVDRKLSYQEFDNAFVLPSKDLWKDGKCPGGVVTADGVFVESSAWHEGNRCCAYDFDTSLCRADSRTVIYMGFYNPCWGHAITDNLKKLWFLNTPEGEALIDAGAQLAYIANWRNTPPQYITRIFELAGININDCFHIKKITKFDVVYIPENAFYHRQDGIKVYHPLMCDIYNRIKKNIHLRMPIAEKLYFTRRRLTQTWARDNGEKDLEKAFRNEGYQIVSPENLTFDEQVSALMQCKHFAATEGSISHNAIWCQPNTEVIILRKANVVNTWQLAINEMAKIKPIYIDAHNSVKANLQFPMVGPFFMCITPELERYLGHRVFHLPLALRPSWWKYLCRDKYWYKRTKHILQRLKLIH